LSNVDFGGDEEGGPGKSGLLDCETNFGFILVELCGVDVPVAGGEGGEDGGHALGAWGLEDAKAETGDGDGGVREGKCGCYCKFWRCHCGSDGDLESYVPVGVSGGGELMLDADLSTVLSRCFYI